MPVGDAQVFPGFLTPVVLTQLSFKSHRLLFFHAFLRGERRKKFASTWYQTHNHHVMSQTGFTIEPPGHGSTSIPSTAFVV